jgi:peptidoglycan/LPS O-acetylase OafA/YrhL
MSLIKRMATLVNNERFMAVAVAWALSVAIIGAMASSVTAVTPEMGMSLIFISSIFGIILGLWLTRNFKKGHS